MSFMGRKPSGSIQPKVDYRPTLVSQRPSTPLLPALIQTAGANASRRFLEFFTAQIRNRNTRDAYRRSLLDFLAWCDDRGWKLESIEPIHVAAYVEYLSTIYSPPTVKQHLSAIKRCFDWLVTGQILPTNPAASVRGPKYVVKRGKTPVLSPEEARELLDSIDCSTVIGLRDRALLGVMLFSFARISAVLAMSVNDFCNIGKRSWLRLHEKGGKYHEVPVHHKARRFLDEYIQKARLQPESDSPLFLSVRGRSATLSNRRLTRRDALKIVKRRAKSADLSQRICNHSCRATGITTYLQNGGTLEKAQAMAGHESPRTTMLYDRTSDEITADEVERILI